MTEELKIDEPKHCLILNSDVRKFKFDGEVVVTKDPNEPNFSYRLDIFELGRTNKLRKFRTMTQSISLGIVDRWNNYDKDVFISPFSFSLKLFKHTSRVDIQFIAERHKVNLEGIDEIIDTKTFCFETLTSATRREGIL